MHPGQGEPSSATTPTPQIGGRDGSTRQPWAAHCEQPRTAACPSCSHCPRKGLSAGGLHRPSLTPYFSIPLASTLLIPSGLLHLKLAAFEKFWCRALLGKTRSQIDGSLSQLDTLMQAQRMTKLGFAIIFNAEGKRYLTVTLKAAEIISLVCFEAQFAEESHVLIAPGAGWVPAAVQSMTVSRWLGAMGAGVPGKPLARAAVGVGEQGALGALAGWEAWWWLKSNSRGLPLTQTSASVVLTGWEERQRRPVEFVALKHAWWVQSLLAPSFKMLIRSGCFDTEDFDIRHVPLTLEGFGQAPGRLA